LPKPVPLEHVITSTAGAGGSISPSGAVPVNSGASQSFTITPRAGYRIAEVAVDGTSIGTRADYIFTNVTADHTINVRFAPLEPEPDGVETNSIGMKLVQIPAGSFSTRSNDSAMKDGQHVVSISHDFWMGQTEVTQGQYEAVMNAQPWSGEDYVQEDANNPAVYVSWDDAMEFCKKLSQREGKTYRLPTEAEWEYACRAGTTTRFSFYSDSSLGNYAWIFDNTCEVDQAYAHAVGQKKPNPWDMYDMHGNVWEWCSNWYGPYPQVPATDPQGPSSGTSRVLRGGSWCDAEHALHCSCRGGARPHFRSSLVGFRVVRPQP
ncbi:MAG: SUMF1/EgtB/PvdO family nonheme iron enzyme, partial [Planctomycetota bacterium]